MSRMRPLPAAFTLAMACFCAASVRAGDAIKMVPPDALGVVVACGLDALDAKLQKAGESLELPVPGIAIGVQQVPGLAESLDWSSPIVVAVFQGPESGDNPVPVAYVPVTNFAKYAECFGGEKDGDLVRLSQRGASMLAAEREGYALIVRNDDDETLKTALESPGGLAERLGDDLVWIEQRDIAALMTDNGISVLCDKMLEGIRVAQQAVRAQGNDPIGAADILGVYSKVLAVVDQEAELVAMGLDLQESGDLVLHVRKRFLPAGQIAQCLTLPDPPADILAGLPAVPFVVAGGCQFTPAAGDLMMKFSVEVMKSAPKLYGISDAEAERMLQSAKPMMDQMQSLAMMLAVGSKEDTLYSRMVGVMKSGDAKKYMEAYEKYLREFSGMVKGSEGIFSMEMESKPIEVEGCQGFEISMKMPQNLVQGDRNAEAMLEKMIGPDGKIRVFVVAADEHNVLIGYTNENLLLRAIAALRNGESASQQALVQQAASKLEAGNLGQGYLSPTGLVEFVNTMIQTMAPADSQFQLPGFPEVPPVAWTANAEKALADAQIVVPGELIKAAVGYAAQVRQAFDKAEE